MHIQIYDTTLRDGAQGEGVSFSLEDKILIARRLDELGFDYIEGGYPLSNPKDAEFFQRLAAESKSVLLSYWLSPRTSYVWVITPAAVRAIPLASSAEIGRLVEDYTAALRNPAMPLTSWPSASVESGAMASRPSIRVPMNSARAWKATMS